MHREKPDPKRFLSFLWYVPVLIVLAMGTFVSLDRGTTSGILQKARTFQGTQEASTELELIRSASYSFTVNLDETYRVVRGSFKTEGDFRAGDVMEIPYDLKGMEGHDLSSIRLRFVEKGDKAILKGFFLRGRACSKPWVLEAGQYRCEGPNEVRIPGMSLTSDTIEAIDPSRTLGPSDTDYLLLQIEPEPDLILPVKGYKISLVIEETGLKVKL